MIRVQQEILLMAVKYALTNNTYSDYAVPESIQDNWSYLNSEYKRMIRENIRKHPLKAMRIEWKKILKKN